MSSQFGIDYDDFRRYVFNGNEHVLPDSVRRFLNGVGTTMQERLETLPQGYTLFRAQRGNDWSEDEISPDGEHFRPGQAQCFDVKRMTPCWEKVPDGRLNKRRKPIFYASNTPETAVKETRPWIGSFVSVATFETKRDLQMVNCLDAYLGFEQGWMFSVKRNNLTDEEFEQRVWHRIAESLSTPVTNEDDPRSYLPTQIIAECFSTNGADGLICRSAMEKSDACLEEVGCNAVIFDVDAVEMKGDRWVSKITGINLQLDNGPHC